MINFQLNRIYHRNDTDSYVSLFLLDAQGVEINPVDRMGGTPAEVPWNLKFEIFEVVDQIFGGLMRI